MPANRLRVNHCDYSSTQKYLIFARALLLGVKCLITNDLD